VPVFQIDSLSLDMSHLTELVGHQTTVTAITDLQEGLVATGDDKGTVRIWDLTKMRCQQVLKVGNSLSMI
jgi:WD40 repeat protein